VARAVEKVNLPLAVALSESPPLLSKVTELPVLNPEIVPPIVKLLACARVAEARTRRDANTAVTTFIESVRIGTPAA
jgi:hypothetical protein